MVWCAEPVFTQHSEWSTPVSLTDSVSNNVNAQIHFIKLDHHAFYAFWEKSFDDQATSIYYKNFYSNDDPEVFIQEDNVHITNLQLISLYSQNPNSDTSFYAFYESDKSGINRIYYRTYSVDGLQDEKELTSSTNEQSDLQCNNNGRIVWMEQDKVMHMLLDIENLIFDTPVVIDSGNCSFPCIQRPGEEWWWGGGFPAVSWIKEENNNSYVKISNYDNELGWLDPLTLFMGTECTNLTYCNGIGPLSILTWDYYNDTAWRVVTYDLESSQAYQSGYSSNNTMFPQFLSGFLMVKSLYFDVGISSIIYEEDGNENIFSAPFNFGPLADITSYENVSQTDNQVRNTALHIGEVVGCNHYFINTWEEEVNGNWQVKYSISSACLSDVASYDDEKEIDLSITPNPVKDIATVSFNLEEKSGVSVFVYNMNGKLVDIVEKGEMPKGKNQLNVNCSDLKSGVYIFKLKSNLSNITRKVLVKN